MDAPTRSSDVLTAAECIPVEGADACALHDRVAEQLFRGSAVAAHIGRFLVLHKIGSGGLGVVYAAYDPKLDRRVAIKLMRRGQGSMADPRRVLREAQALARLSHPNVVAVHEVGEHAEGLFIAMELVEGPTLREWAAEAPRKAREALRPLLEAARGLAQAHRAGIVHRDFKPANVIVGNDGRTRVLDFGLARAAADGPSDVQPAAQAPSALDMQLTHHGTVLGTPCYLAPEQWSRGAIDGRTDQWAYCVTALELLWGERPFGAADVATLRSRVCSGDLELPASRRRLPGRLEHALLRGLSVDPSARHASMDALLVVLERAANGRASALRRFGLALGLVAAGAIAGGGVALRTQPGASMKVVEHTLADARAAAAAGHYVYPPSTAPDAPTAYDRVLALEAITGANAEAARVGATDLRRELAAALVVIGDSYWDDPDTRPFAIDFYAATLLFDATDEHAASRVRLTPGELASLRASAADHEFTVVELGLGDLWAALAARDPDVRAQKVDALRRASPDALAASTRARLSRVLGEVDHTAEVNSAESSPAQQTHAAPSLAAPDLGTGAVAPEPPSPRDSERRASDLVVAGRRALRAGSYAEAERLLHGALTLDSRSHAALSVLSDCAFERSVYEDAVEYARRAVAVAPKNAKYRMQLGDAQFKVLRYEDARSSYLSALELGHPRASSALERLSTRSKRIAPHRARLP